jgi:hypothetical protein
MATEPKSRRRRRKKILRKNDGSLFDATERRRITPAELRDYVRDGGLFEARRQENGADCTYEVLQGVVGTGLLQNLVPGMGGGALPGLGGLSALAGGGGGALGALGGAAGLADLARVLGDQAGRSGDRGWDDWEEPRRRSTRHSSSDRGWDDGDWSDPPGRPHRRDSADWAPDPDFD